MPSTRDIAFIGCRLLALYFLCVALLNIPHSLLALAGAFAGGQLQDSQQLFYRVSDWLVLASPVLTLAMVLLLWFGAGWLSREVADGAPEATPVWSPQSLLSVGLVLLGLGLASFALPQIAFYLLYIANGTTEAESLQVSYLVSQVVQTLVGIGLILGSGRISATTTRLRGWSAVSEK